MTRFKTGNIFITNGGWKAVVCWEEIGTVFHVVGGGKLYTHNKEDGTVSSVTVGSDYNLRYELREL